MAILRKAVCWASTIHKSRTISFLRWLCFPEGKPTPPPILLSLGCLAAAEVMVPWVLWKIGLIGNILPLLMLARILYRLRAGGYVRQLRGWFAATYFPSVDLQQLCDSYRYEGEMDLPRELIDGIMRYNDLQTLKSCSLTSRAFYSAARPLIHRRMVLGARSAVRGSHLEKVPLDFDKAEVPHARYLSAAEDRGLLRYGYVREVDLDLGIGNPENVLRLQQLRALETVHTLTINMLDLHKILPVFGRCFSQFVPTLRSLSLKSTRCENAQQLMEFVCRFPSLDNLELINPRGLGNSGFAGAPPKSAGPQPQQPLPFGGQLVLTGTGPLIQCLLDLPGGIRFRSIDASSNLRGLESLLVACSSTLEVLSIRCFESFLPSDQWLREHTVDQRPGEVLNVDLGWNRKLRRFELEVDFAELDILPRFLHKALTSIWSPHFSEFSLRLSQGGLEFNPDGGPSNRKTLWGAGWEVVDEDLYAHAVQREDFRFVVQIVNGESTEAAVEALFPRMKSNRSLLITRQQLLGPW